MIELVPLNKEIPEGLPHPPPPTPKLLNWPSPTNQEKRLQNKTYLTGILSLDFPASRTVKNRFLSSLVFYYDSPS